MSETPQGYQGPLPAYYVQSSTPQTVNLGLTLTGVDPILAYNLVLIDTAVGSGGGTSVSINGSTVSTPNFNNTTPAAPSGSTNITWQVVGSNVSAYLTGVFPNTNAGGAGLALGAYNSATGNFTTVSVGSGTVTSFSAGALSPLFTTNVATATTTPALTFALSNAGGGTVFANNTTSAAAPAYTITPVLGIPGTSNGTIALASSTASGKFTLVSPASSATPTLTLPTTSNVLAGQFAGDGVVYSASLVTASAAGTLTLPSPSNQNANLAFMGPSSGSAATPAFRSITGADLSVITNAQSGTTYTFLDTDRGKLVSFTNASPIAVTLPQAGAASAFLAGWYVDVNNEGAGLVIITPTTSTIDGLASSSVAQFQGYRIVSNGTNYLVVRGVPIFATKTANTVFAGPTSGGSAIPAFRALVVADIPNATITPIWNNLQNASGALTLANGTNATTFNQTSAVNWTWANTTPTVTGSVNTMALSTSTPPSNVAGSTWRYTFAVSESGAGSNAWVGASVTISGYTGGAVGNNGTFVLTASTTTTFDLTNASGTTTNTGVPVAISSAVVSSPAILLSGTINSGSAGTLNSIADTWTIQCTPASVVPNPVSQLVFAHSGGSGTPAVVPSGTITLGSSTVRWNNVFMSTGNCSGIITSAAFASVTANPAAAGVLRLASANTINFRNNGNSADINGLSKNSSDVVTVGDAAGIILTGTVTSYSGTATVGQGVPSEIGTVVDSTAQSAAITATNIIASAPRTGMYRISMSATITTASSTSSILGGTNGFQIGFTSPTDSVAKTTVAGNSITTAANTTGTAIADTITVYAKSATAITYAFDYQSTGVTAMQYELHVRLEAL